MTKSITVMQPFMLAGDTWKTLAGHNELRVEELKAEKERVTLMACANAAGIHKLNSVFFYKYQNPRSQKHIDKSKPLYSIIVRKASMNPDIFDRWYNSDFIPSVKSQLKLLGLWEKAILVSDNSPSHTKICQVINQI